MISCDISVTNVVHRLTLPLVICPAIVELSTTVYVTTSITEVSPTLASGHLQVLFSKYILSEVVEVPSGQVPHIGVLGCVRAALKPKKIKKIDPEWNAFVKQNPELELKKN